MCNIYYFSTGTVVARTSLSATLYVHCLSFLNLFCLKMENTLNDLSIFMWLVLITVTDMFSVRYELSMMKQ
jgi:hypothetical protein